MGHIEVVEKEAKEDREKIKEYIKAEMKAIEARVMAEVDTLKGVIEYIHNSAFVFNIILLVLLPLRIL